MHKTFSWRNRVIMLASAAMLCGLTTPGYADEEKGEPVPAPQIEIRGVGGAFGGGGFGVGLPKEFEAMMKAAQEIQGLQSKYDASVAELIDAAKNLEQAENLMDSVTKVAKLAKASEELQADIAKRKDEMAKNFGGGGAIVGGFGIGGAIDGDGVKILPIAPTIEFKVDGVELEVPKVDPPKVEAPKVEAPEIEE